MPNSASPVSLETIRIVDSDTLFAGAHEIVITHNGVLYRLRITRQDKLILTK
jgi:hemin uptake protein HemP